MGDSVKVLIDWLSDDATKAWIVALATAIGAILAWVTKLKWAEEYKKAVEAKISLAETQIALLEKNAELSAELNEERAALAKSQIEFAEQKFRDLAEFTPGKMRGLLTDERQFYQEKIESLNKTLNELKQELLAKDNLISGLKEQAGLSAEELETLEIERENLFKKVSYLEDRLSDMAKYDEQLIKILEFMDRPDFSTETVQTAFRQFDTERDFILQKTKARFAKARAIEARRKREAEKATKERRIRSQGQRKNRSGMYQSRSLD